MSVAFDAAGTAASFGSATSFDYTGITVGTGSNRCLLLYIQFTVAVTGISANWDSAGTNQAMTQLQFQNYGGSNTTNDYSFYLLNPTSGNKNLHVSWTTATFTHAIGFSVTGANQTGGATTFYSQHQDSDTGVGVTTFSETFTVNSGDLGVVYSGNSFSAGASVNQTQWVNDASGAMGNYALGTGASITFTHNFGGAAGFAMLGNAIAAAPTAQPFSTDTPSIVVM